MSWRRRRRMIFGESRRGKRGCCPRMVNGLVGHPSHISSSHAPQQRYTTTTFKFIKLQFQIFFTVFLCASPCAVPNTRLSSQSQRVSVWSETKSSQDHCPRTLSWLALILAAPLVLRLTRYSLVKVMLFPSPLLFISLTISQNDCCGCCRPQFQQVLWSSRVPYRLLCAPPTS